MTTTTHDDKELVSDGLEQPHESASAERTPITSEQTQTTRDAPFLPWIGATPSPHLGPMVVVDENGYLVPLCTAGDLLRGFRRFWRISQE